MIFKQIKSTIALIIILFIIILTFTVLGKLGIFNIFSWFGNLFKEELKIGNTSVVINDIKDIAKLYSYGYYSQSVIHKKIIKKLPEKISINDFKNRIIDKIESNNNNEAIWYGNKFYENINSKELLINKIKSFYKTDETNNYFILNEIKDKDKSFLKIILSEIDFEDDESKKESIVIIYDGKVYAGFDLKNLNKNNIIIQETEGNKKSITIKLKKPEILQVIINPSGFETFIDEPELGFDATNLFKIKALHQLKQSAIDIKLLEKAESNGKKMLEDFLKRIGFNIVTFEITG